MFKVRAYESRAAGESGRVTPAYSSSSGSYATANHVATTVAIHYGAAVLENTETGRRSWYVRRTAKSQTKSKP